jgi:amino acid permease
MTNASWIASIACYAVYITVAFLGYLTYGNDPLRPMWTNFLKILRKDEIGDLLYITMTVMFIVSMLCSFPLVFFAARNNFIAIVNSLRNKGDK